MGREKMTCKKRLQLHLKEADVHIERLKEILEYLKSFYPLDIDSFEDINRDKLDAFVFRFAKLQDLLGAKIFREYLESVNFPTVNKDFLSLLKELEKEGIIDIDKWAEFRSVRNSIAHDYPYDESEKIDAINYIIKNIGYLFEVIKKIEDKIETK